MSAPMSIRPSRRHAALAPLLLALACTDLNIPTPLPITQVRLSPDTVALQIGDSAQITAAPLDSGNTLQSRTVVWTSAAPGVATVNAAGLVHGAAAGTTTVTASVAGVNGTTVVVVTGPPTTVAIAAGDNQSAAVNAAVAVPPSVKVTDASGNPVPR